MKLLIVGAAVVTSFLLGADSLPAQTSTWNDGGSGTAADSSWAQAINWTGGVPGTTSTVIIGTQPASGDISLDTGSAITIASLTFDNSGAMSFVPGGSPSLQVNGFITNSTSFGQTFAVEVIAGASATYDGGSLGGSSLSFTDGLNIGLNNIATSGTVNVGTIAQNSSLTFAIDTLFSYGKIGAITTTNVTVEITGNYAATASVANGNAGDLFQLSTGSSFSGATLDTGTLPTLDSSLVWITSLFPKGILLVQPSAGGNIFKSPFVVPIDNDNEFNTGGITLNGGELLTSNNSLDLALPPGTPFSTTRAIGVTSNSGAIAASAGTTATYNGSISDAVFGTPGLLTVGDTSISVGGTGTVVFTAANSYSGGTQLYGGTLQLSGAGTLGATTNFLTIKSGILDLNGTQQTVAALILGSGGSELSDSTGTAAMLTATGTTVDGSNNIIDSTVTLVSPTVTIDGAGTLTLNGTIQGNVAVNSGLIGGTIYPGTLSGSGTVTGTTVVTGLTSGGTSTGSALTGTGLGLTLDGLVTFNGPANTLGGTVTANAGVTVASGGAVTQTGTLTGSLTSVAGTFTANGTVTGNAAIASGGTLAGTGSVGGTTDVTGGTVNGNGLILTALTTFHGATGNVLSGTESGDVSVASGGAVTQTGGTLTGDLTSVAGSFTADGTITGNAGIITGGTLAGSGTVEGTTDVNNAVVNGNGLTLTGLTTFHGANNSLDGTVTSTDGVTSTGGNLTIGSSANLTANGGLSVTGGTLAAADSTSTITGSVTYSSSSDSTFGGVIAGGTSAVTKNGAATLNLTGTNTYGGATDVNAGTLALTATGSLGASSITVANGATLASLGATNSVGGPITLDNGGAINLQNSATNTLDGTALNVAAGGNGTLNIDVGSGGSDLINLSGGAVLGANSSLTVNVASLGGEAVGTQYAFLTAAGGLTNFSSSDISGNLTGTAPGYTLAFSTVGNTAYFTINGAAGTNYYYNGASGGTGTNFALASNFDTDATSGIVQSTGPSATSNIFIATNTPSNLTPTLGSNLTINTLNFTPTGSGATLSGAGTLTINSALTVQTGVTGTETISAAVDLGGSQVWTVTDAGSTLVDSGGIGESGGSFALTKAGAGTLILTGTNTYSGGTTISAGSLQVGDGTTSNGSLGGGTVLDNASLVFDPHTTSTIANTITGTGTVTQNGPGTTILTGNGSSYSGVTTITSGVLQIGDGTTSNGSLGTGGVTDNATLVFDPFTSSTISNAITGSGTVTQNGPGTTILTSTTNAYSTTTITAGTLQIGNGTTSNGSLGTGGVTDNATLVFDPFTTNTIANAITGSGTVTQNGPGTTILTSTANGYGPTTITSGTLQIGNGTTSNGSLGIGGVTDNASLVFDPFTTSTIANAITGSGSVTQNGPGTTILTSTTNAYGTTAITAGTLQVGDGATSNGSLGTGSVTDNAALVFDPFTTGTIANAITGSGTVTQNGPGTTILTSTGNAYGTTTITSGTLQIGDGATSNGSLGTGGVTDNASLVFDPLTTSTIANAITGSGTVTQNGPGKTILTSTSNAYGTTTITSGTLQIGDGATSNGSLGTGGVTDNASLVFDPFTTSTIANSITGSGSVTQNGPGTTVLSGANSYTGATAVNSGALNLQNDSALGTGAGASSSGVTVASGAALQLQGGISTTTAVALTLNGTGAGNGALENVSGANTYSGLVTLGSNSTIGSDAGTLSLANTGTITGSGFGLTLIGSGDGNIASIIGTGSGSLTKTGSGTWTLAGANTYSGGTTLSSGTLAVTGTGTLGASTGALTVSGGTLDLGTTSQTVGAVSITAASTIQNGTLTGTSFTDSNASGTATVSAALAGTGTLTQSGTGTLALSGANIYSGGTILSAGTLDVTGSGTLGQAGSALTVSGGLLDLGTTNQALGAVSITAASTIQDGTLTGTSFTDSTASGTAIVSAALAGSGGLTKSGAGTLALSGANSYAGDTAINAGILEVGSASALGLGSVTNNATLETFGGQHVIAVGTNFTQGAGGTLVINLNGNPGSNPGVNDSNDILSVAGTATLNGTLSLNFTFAPVTGQTFEVVATGGGIIGTPGANFTVPTVAPPGLMVTTSESSNGDDFFVTINSTQLRLTSIPGIVYTPNEAAIANYISANVTSGPLFTALTQIVISDPHLLPGIQDQLSPEKFASFARSNVVNNAVFSTQLLDDYLEGLRSPQGDFLAGNGQIDSSGLSISDPTIDPGLSQVRSRLLAWSPAPYDHGLLSDTPTPVLGGIDMKAMPPSPPPVCDNPFNVFVAGNAILAQNFSQPDLVHSDSTSGAVQVGADYRITPHLRVGAVFGYGHTDASLDNIGSKATLDSYAPGGYLSFADKGWYANGVATYGFDNFTEDRHVAFPGFTEVAHGAPSGSQVVANLDGGYDFHVKNWTFGPLTGLQYTHLNVDSYREDGAGAVDLQVGHQETDSLRSQLGGHVSYSVHAGKIVLTPHLDASWQHEFMDQSDGIDAQIINVTGVPFAVRTPNPSRESALIDGGLNAELNGQVSIFADYVVQAGQSNYIGQSVQAGVKLGF